MGFNSAFKGLMAVQKQYLCLLTDSNLTNNFAQEQSNELSNGNSAVCLRVGLLPAAY